MVNKEWYIHTVDYHSAIRKTNYCQIQQPGWTSNACAQNSPIQRASVYDILVKAEPQGQKTYQWFPGTGGWGGFDYKGQEDILGLMDLFYILTTTLCISQNSQNHTLERINFTVCKSHLIKKFAWAWGRTLRLSFLSTAAPDSQSGPFVFSLLQGSAVSRREERKAGTSILGSSFREGSVLHSCSSCCVTSPSLLVSL